MAKQSTHSELEQLFEVARCDVPSVAEQNHLHASVLTALRTGAAPQSSLSELPLDQPSLTMGPTLKLILSMGAIAVLAAGVTQLRHHFHDSSRHDSSGLTPISSTVTDFGRSALDAPPTSVPAQTPDDAKPPQQSPAILASADITPTLNRTATAKPPSSEVAIIEQARRKLQNNPARALALTETHRKRYPKGILVQEREVIAIEALARLGKSKAAESRVDAFRAEQPHSIHDLHLRSTLGDAGVRPTP